MAEYLDYIILAFLIIGFLLGFKDGFIKKIFSFIGFVSAIILAFYLSPSVRVWLVKLLDVKPDIAVIISFTIVFLFFILIFKLIIKLIRPKVSVFGFIDRLLGGILGGFQMGLFISAILIVLNLLNFPSPEEKANLKYYEFTYKLLPSTFSFIKEILPESEIIFKIIKDLNIK